MSKDSIDELICKVVGAAMTVQRNIGYGLRGKTYEPALMVDTNTIESIGDYKLGRMLASLRITGKSTGLIINFKHPSLQWRKVTLAPVSEQSLFSIN